MLPENIFPGKLAYIEKYSIFYNITDVNLIYSTETQKNSTALKHGSLCMILSFNAQLNYSAGVVFVILPGGCVGYVGISSLEEI